MSSLETKQRISGGNYILLQTCLMHASSHKRWIWGSSWHTNLGRHLFQAHQDERKYECNCKFIHHNKLPEALLIWQHGAMIERTDNGKHLQNRGKVKARTWWPRTLRVMMTSDGWPRRTRIWIQCELSQNLVWVRSEFSMSQVWIKCVRSEFSESSLNSVRVKSEFCELNSPEMALNSD